MTLPLPLPLPYEDERQRVLATIENLLRKGEIDCSGGAFSIRLADGNFLVTPTGIATERWAIDPDDLVVMDGKGNPHGPQKRLSAAPTPLFLGLYRTFPAAGAMIHAHAEWSLLYAARGLAIPSVINGFDVMGEVPCIECHDHDLKEQFRREPWPVFFPAAMVRRPDVAAVEADIEGKVRERMAHRGAELESHALAFTLYRHGIVVLAKDLDLAAYSLATVEVNARTAYRLELAQRSHEGHGSVPRDAGLTGGSRA
jgi:ribulose-5-phosphate 4-epimerase/fuculose-1-phosphate aldolase